MTKYKVKVIHIFNEVFDVEAASEEAAKDKVVDILSKDQYEGSPNYETTLPPDNWPIITEEDFNKLVEESVQEQKEPSNIITP